VIYDPNKVSIYYSEDEWPNIEEKKIIPQEIYELLRKTIKKGGNSTLRNIGGTNYYLDFNF